MNVFLELGVLFVVLVVIGIIISILRSQYISNQRKEISGSVAKLPGFTSSFQYSGVDGQSGIAIDEPNAKVCLLHRNTGILKHRVVTHRDIISSELFEDGATITKTIRSSQIGGAVVGGVLLGEAGAVIGGLSGKKVEETTIKRIELRLVVNDSTEPVHNVCFLNSESKRGGILYNIAAKEARQWQARMVVLIKRAERESLGEQQSQSNSSASFSVSDELRKLAELKLAGVLTEGEFNAQKTKLLK